MGRGANPKCSDEVSLFFFRPSIGIGTLVSPDSEKFSSGDSKKVGASSDICQPPPSPTQKKQG